MDLLPFVLGLSGLVVSFALARPLVAERMRRRSDETMRELGGRLIAAQEEERRRIARELHDDVSQRMALLSVELEHLGMQRRPGGESDDRWKALSRSAEIATDAAPDLAPAAPEPSRSARPRRRVDTPPVNIASCDPGATRVD
jgi:signal transduction histidine kinase